MASYNFILVLDIVFNRFLFMDHPVICLLSFLITLQIYAYFINVLGKYHHEFYISADMSLRHIPL